MPTISAEYKAELTVNKLFMEPETYTISAQGEDNIKYAVDTTLTSYDDANGTLLSGEVEITPTSYITFVSDKGYMILEISTENTGVVFGTVQTKEEKQDEDISGNSQKLENISEFQVNKYENITPTESNPEGYYEYTTGNVIAVPGDQGYRYFDPISVEPGEIYRISGISSFAANLFVVTNESGNVLLARPNKNSSGTDPYKLSDFEIPAGGVSLLVNDRTNDTVIEKYVGDTQKETLKIGVIGDSLSDPDNNYTPFYWDYWLEVLDGYEIQNVAVSGSGYRNNYDEGSAFYQLSNNLNSDCDIVIVFGSFNDIGEISGGFPIGTLGDTSPTSIFGNISTTIDTINAVCTDASILLVTPAPWDAFRPSDGAGSNQVLYVDAIVDSARYRGVSLLDFFRTSGMRPWEEDFKEKYSYNKDTVHWNGEANKRFIYPQIREAVKSLR